jgi:carbon monoxide dehydrogenase subunit G
MTVLEQELIINRPLQDVWDYISDPSKLVEWQASAESFEWTSDPPYGVGSTMLGVAKLIGRKVESKSEITVWDPPTEYGLKQVGGPIPFRATIKLQSTDNVTRLTVRGEMEIGGLFKIAEGLVLKQMQKEMDKDYNALKDLLEKSQRSEAM